ncbi:MAG: hypothetical protein SPI77_01245 [Corynebacterium sp.]|nr:hypothetical protein [Corynebacterium sp.]
MRTRMIAGFTAAAVALSATPAFAVEETSPTTWGDVLAGDYLSDTTKTAIADLKTAAAETDAANKKADPKAETYDPFAGPAAGIFGGLAASSSEKLAQNYKDAADDAAKEKVSGSSDTLAKLGLPGLQNDVKAGQALGTTADGLLGALIAVIVLGVLGAVASATGLLNGILPV